MLEILERNPGTVLRSENQVQTKSLISELGLAGRFSLNPPGVRTGQRSIQAVTYGQHPMHFILAVLCLGNSDPHNGYVITCHPKTQISSSQFMKVAKGILTDRHTVGAKVFWNESLD